MRITIILIFSFLIISFPSRAQNWQQFESGVISGTKFYLDSTTNTLFLCGEFLDSITGDTIYTPAYWNGTKWKQVGDFDFSGTGPIRSLFIYDGEIYIFGDFKRSYGAPGDYFLKLNTANSWDTLNLSGNGAIYSGIVHNGLVYLGGKFSGFGQIASCGIINFNGSAWSPFPNLLCGLPEVRVINTFNGNLIFAGSFFAPINAGYYGSIIGWDGTSFIPIGDGIESTGLTSTIYDLEVYDDKLVIAGDFNAGNIPNGNRIAMFDGINWSGLSLGINYTVRSLQKYNGNLYAGGSFTQAGNLIVSNIAQWNGVVWCSSGSVFNGNINDMCVYNNELLVVGNFTNIDGQNINHIAKWNGGVFVDSCESSMNVEDAQINCNFSIYPTLTSDYVNIVSGNCVDSYLDIYNCLGVNLFSAGHESKSIIDISEFDSGLYNIIIKSDNKQVYRFKFIKI